MDIVAAVTGAVGFVSVAVLVYTMMLNATVKKALFRAERYQGAQKGGPKGILDAGTRRDWDALRIYNRYAAHYDCYIIRSTIKALRGGRRKYVGGVLTSAHLNAVLALNEAHDEGLSQGPELYDWEAVLEKVVQQPQEAPAFAAIVRRGVFHLDDILELRAHQNSITPSMSEGAL